MDSPRGRGGMWRLMSSFCGHSAKPRSSAPDTTAGDKQSLTVAGTPSLSPAMSSCAPPHSCSTQARSRSRACARFCTRGMNAASSGVEYPHSARYSPTEKGRVVCRRAHRLGLILDNAERNLGILPQVEQQSTSTP
jgi:hypothetical protein